MGCRKETAESGYVAERGRRFTGDLKVAVGWFKNSTICHPEPAKDLATPAPMDAAQIEQSR
ncbi:hypothetical protein GCM10011495_19740 [Hymenobacter frigidus]|uniref:Uncharacterized protein n=1 Tax=Hymenobacter frigidus TaxID=1524095 RepID=A0ABQ2A6W9_9BACT|nr:hypothetical protein GCM10011495_19740 [Hymenobacter frigidus]